MNGLFSDPAAYLLELIPKLPALLAAVTVHELAHALVADRLGDPTARRLGRITLNPLPHLDPLGALAFLLAGFGWAKPVPVNAQNLRHPVRDMAWVAVAGPVSNFAAAFVALLALRLLGKVGSGFPFVAEPLGIVLFWVYLFNLALGIFNLIPLPPLDGGHFLPYLFPRASWPFIHQLEQAGPFLLILLVLSGATRYVVQPALNLISGFYLAIVRLLI
jgi:Zn-dependent protease